MCNVSSYHRTHPLTGLEFDYDHGCANCIHFSIVTRKKVKVVRCALAPQLDGDKLGGQVREAFPACEAWELTKSPKKRPLRRRRRPETPSGGT